MQLPNGQRVAVIRIASFEDNAFIDLCERAMRQLSIAADSICTGGCEAALDRATANEVTAALIRQIRVAQAQSIHALLVDITHNGGGTNWVEAAARVFTPIPLKAPRMAFVRHDHHVKQFAEKIAELRAARPQDAEAITEMERARLEAATACDRTPLWEGRSASCTGLVSASPLPSRYRFQEAAYRGKLYVLVDRETASAAEYFAAVLQDNGAAVLLGEATYGAGCGYTNGGIPTKLAFSGARVLMPDCVRYRANGTNEVDGIIPDMLVPWRANDSEFQRAEKVLRVLMSN